MSESLVRVKDLTTSYTIKSKSIMDRSRELKAVNQVSFDVRRGETLGVIGESGCGKSTLGKALLNLIPSKSGSVTYKDQEILGISNSEMKSLRKEMQIIFQDPYSSLDPRKTTFQLIEEPMVIHKIGTKETREKRVYQLLEEVGLLSEHAHRHPHEFSGGQRQRINIARALALNPEFIVCDEPVSALDVSVQAQVINLLSELQKKHGFTYIFISHDLSVVKYISDRLIIMYLGFILEEGPAERIYREACHPYTKALFASIPPESPFEEKKENILKGELPSPLNLPSGCPLSTRCPLSRDLCRQQTPQLQSLAEDGHRVACHYPEEGKLL